MRYGVGNDLGIMYPNLELIHYIGPRHGRPCPMRGRLRGQRAQVRLPRHLHHLPEHPRRDALRAARPRRRERREPGTQFNRKIFQLGLKKNPFYLVY